MKQGSGGRGEWQGTVGRGLLLASFVCLLLSFAAALWNSTSYAAGRPDLAEGARLFQTRGCAHCHGADMTGTKRGPNLTGIGSKWSRRRIERQIRHGGQEMPPFGKVLTHPELRDLVALCVDDRGQPAPPKVP